MRKALAILVLTILAGCASPLIVERYADFNTEERSFVLLTTTKYDSDFRSAIHKQGLKLLKFPSQRVVIQNDNQRDRKDIFQESQARYGISMTYNVLDSRRFGAMLKIDVSIEITDLANNEVVILIKKGGWDNVVFEEIAKELKTQWH